MNPFRVRMALAALAITIAFLLTLASVLIQRVGPLVPVTGEGFCPDGKSCLVPALAGGFPLPYLIDNPQISVPNALFIIEDHFRPGAFFLDFFIYLLGVVLLGKACILRSDRRGRDPEL